MKKTLLLGIAVAAAFVVMLWIFVAKPYQSHKAVLVNLQVTESKDPAALAKVVNAMEMDGIRPSTIFVGKDVVEQNCSLIRELDEKGYEIAAFGYNLSANGAFIQIATLPKEQQEQIINSTKAAIEGCVGHSINGFRAQRFSKNNYTNEIVKNLGFKWDGSFVTGADSDASSFPYYSDKYGFYVVSIQGIVDAGKSYVLCDQAMASSNKTALQWREAVQSYYLKDQQDVTPFVTEFHPSFLVSNSTWWDNFTILLGWLKKQNSTYLTTQQLINNCTAQFGCGE